MKTIEYKFKKHRGVSWWLSRLRIWRCHCCGTVRSLAWELLYAEGVAKKKKKKPQRKGSHLNILMWVKSDYFLALWHLPNMTSQDVVAG